MKTTYALMESYVAALSGGTRQIINKPLLTESKPLTMKDIERSVKNKGWKLDNVQPITGSKKPSGGYAGYSCHVFGKGHEIEMTANADEVGDGQWQATVTTGDDNDEHSMRGNYDSWDEALADALDWAMGQ